MHYRTGGVQSGFRHVEADQKPPPVLLHVKVEAAAMTPGSQTSHVVRHLFDTKQGKEHARVKEVPLGVDSLNSGDTFILDLYDKLFLWIGKDSNIQEQIKAREVVTALKVARNGQPQVRLPACIPDRSRTGLDLDNAQQNWASPPQQAVLSA